MRHLMQGAYRLFFSAAGLFAALAILLWLAEYSGFDLNLPEGGLFWHRHEMLFGYLGLTLGGFLLTAVPNWTGRAAVTGLPLALLFCLWASGRVGVFLLPWGAVLVMAYPVALAGVITREIWVSGNRRNLPVAGMVWLFAISDAIFLWGDDMLGQRSGFALALVLISLIGGRVTPAFARNWLKARGRSVVIPAFGLVDKIALAAAVAAALCWVVMPEQSVTGALALFAAGALLVRLARWKAWSIAREPLLLALFLGYGWVVISFALQGASVLGGHVQEAQVVHAIGAGAVGGMTLIVMMRAILGHANHPIVGNRWDVVILTAVHLGAVLRVLAPWASDEFATVQVAGILWASGFAVFVLRYGRMTLMPRRVDGATAAQ